MSNISADGLHLGTILCLAAIFGPLKKRGLITNGEVEEAIRKCSDLVLQGVTTGLSGVVAGEPAWSCRISCRRSFRRAIQPPSTKRRSCPAGLRASSTAAKNRHEVAPSRPAHQVAAGHRGAARAPLPR
jgi:hypothetical protein